MRTGTGRRLGLAWTPYTFVLPGLLVYALGKLSPLVVGLTLLTQPAVSALVGYLAYGERFTALDWAGTAAIAAALVLVRLPQRGLRRDPSGVS